eukprot:2632904-Rhodomonas_salina.1
MHPLAVKVWFASHGGARRSGHSGVSYRSTDARSRSALSSSRIPLASGRAAGGETDRASS